MALFSRLAEDIEYSRAIAKVGVRSNAKFAGNFVGGQKANPINISSELVGIVGDGGNYLLAVLLENRGRIGSGYTMTLQKDHHLCDGFLRLPGRLDALHPPMRDARNFEQSLTLRFNNFQSVKPNSVTIRRAVTG